jgi:hypothetical protein
MLDIAVAYSRYRFLGDEFLTWLWYLIEKKINIINEIDPECVALEIGNRIVLENRTGKSVERITINGDDAGLEEGRIALRKGALVTEMSLVLKTAERQWIFSIKGESLNLSSIKTPGPNLPEDPDQTEVFIFDKAAFLTKSLKFIDNAFNIFIKRRLQPNWSAREASQMKAWINEVTEN